MYVTEKSVKILKRKRIIHVHVPAIVRNQKTKSTHSTDCERLNRHIKTHIHTYNIEIMKIKYI